MRYYMLYTLLGCLVGNIIYRRSGGDLIPLVGFVRSPTIISYRRVYK